MGKRLAVLGLPFAFVGCTIIYNPTGIDIEKHDAPPAPDAPTDADPASLSLLDLAPVEILEGQGDGGSRQAILVIHGANIVTGAQVTITGSSAIVVDNTMASVSQNSDYIAVPVTAHVDATAHDGDLIPLTVEVHQPSGGGMATQSLVGKLALHGLDELTAAPAGNSGANLKALYSQVTLPTTTFGGGQNAPVLVRAVSSVTVGDLTAKGGNASGATAGGAGPGGCPGGAGAADASCDGGGKGAPSGTLGGGGGGGAGFADMGSGGAGGGGAAGGLIVGDDMIATYVQFMSSKANHAAGGGGGGGSIVNAAGGGGGGGGGLVELTAGGNLMVGTIDVTGGTGSNANGAGGGGGAGGVIVVRAGGTLTATMLTAKGGLHGTATNNGGDGSNGRIRWDAPAGTAPSAMPGAVRGPAFVGAPLVLKNGASFTLVGTPNRKLDVYWIDQTGTHAGAQGVSFGGNAMATITPPLVPGLNTVCITLQGGQQGRSEADKCVDVAYVP